MKDFYNEQYDATHYTIAPAFDMPLPVFKKLLSNFALNAIEEAS